MEPSARTILSQVLQFQPKDMNICFTMLLSQGMPTSTRKRYFPIGVPTVAKVIYIANHSAFSQVA